MRFSFGRILQLKGKELQMLELAIIGPEETGKSKLFELLTGVKPKEEVLSESFVPPVGTCPLDEERINALQAILKRPNVIPLSVSILDFPGFSAKTPSRLMNRILTEVKRAEVLLIVLKAFSEQDAGRVIKAFNSFRDELLILDLSIAEHAFNNLKAKLRAMKHPEEDPKYKLLSKVVALLEEQKILSRELTVEERDNLRDLALLSARPWLVVLNLGENVFAKSEVREGLCEYFSDEGVACCPIPVQLAFELTELETEEERAEFRELYGIEEPMVPALKKSLLSALGRTIFYTFNEKEVRGWSVRKGQTAVDAAGEIHSDLARGFIRAEVISFEDFISAGSESAARERNLWRTEGRDYIVKDGDILLVKFRG